MPEYVIFSACYVKNLCNVKCEINAHFDRQQANIPLIPVEVFKIYYSIVENNPFKHFNYRNRSLNFFHIFFKFMVKHLSHSSAPPVLVLYLFVLF